MIEFFQKEDELSVELVRQIYQTTLRCFTLRGEVLNVSGWVRVSELNASEPLRRCRKLESIHQKQHSVACCYEYSGYKLIRAVWCRYREGKTLTQAKQWNRRTWYYQAERIGKSDWKQSESVRKQSGWKDTSSTNCEVESSRWVFIRGGQVRSSDDVLWKQDRAKGLDQSGKIN